MKSTFAASVVMVASFIVFFANPHVAFPDIALTATDDGQAHQNSASIVIDNTSNIIRTSRSGGNQIINGIFEFDLSAYSSSTVVESATLDLQLSSSITSVSGTTASLKVGQYLGDLLVDTGDFADFGDFAGDVLVFDRTSSGGPGIGDVISLSIDTPLIQSVLDDPSLDNLGIRTATTGFAAFAFRSNEGAAALGGLAPTLRLGTAVIPEPATATILATFGCLGLLSRRRKQLS